MQKFAKDFVIKLVEGPAEDLPLFDDWIIDVVRADRKKSGDTYSREDKANFFVPYTNVGGAKNIPHCIPDLIMKYLNDNGFEGQASGHKKYF